MQDLKDEMRGIQVKNFESRWYIPGRDLDRLLSKSVIEGAVTRCCMEAHRQTEAVQVIVKGAKKIFAVLVLMGKELSILNFIEHDHLQDQFLDSKLPFRRSELGEILEDHLAEAFHRTQWVVSAPIFQNDMSHRLLDNDAILPFTKNVKVGCGAFGTVYEVSLDAKHQRIWRNDREPPDLRLIRKELQLSVPNEHQPMGMRSDDLPGKEGHILSLLRLIRHPNIVRLVASYSYRGTYNLIFPRATSDLATFLSTNERPPGFESNDAIVLALQGLCEAVAALHAFIAPEFNLQMKGYHHDLKPENVLVDDAHFLLSDFGLSSLKEMKAKSKTIFKEVNGYYIAPECQSSIEEGFQRNMIGQPADIWALGCILAVVLTYMQMGVQGVQGFELRRKVKVMNWTTYQFHTSGTLNPAVDSWLANLERGGDKAQSGFVRLIRDMLQIEPSHRPDAQKVLSRINLLAARVLHDSIKQKFKYLSNGLNDLRVLIEQDRFTLFGQAEGLDTNGREWAAPKGLSPENLEIKLLREYYLNLGQVLDAAIAAPQRMQSFEPFHGQLRSCVDNYWNLLSHESRLRCESALERKMVSTKDLALLQKIETKFRDEANYRNVGLLAAIKYMTKLSNNCQIQNPTLLWSSSSVLSLGVQVTPQTTMARVRPKDQTSDKDALIDWMEYDARWHDEIAQELFIRVEAIAELLHAADKPSGFRALDCIGYYHNPSRHAFGLVFDLPSPSKSVQGGLTPCTLLSLIHSTRDQEQRPSLGDIFRLAQYLAMCVHEWHKVDWLHKNISAFNVIFFPGQFDSPAAAIAQPYIIGFNHSRPDEKNAFTLGPPANPEQIDYCHPKYLKEGSGYRREYDYYSLGLVLLEIGLWRTLSSLSSTFKGDDHSPEKLREFFLKKYVARLHSTVGKVYQRAVRACLTFDVETKRGEADTSVDDALESFESDVVAQIGRCFA